MQWIPAYCGLAENEQADRLAKAGSKREQQSYPVSFRDARSLIKRTCTSQPGENPTATDRMAPCTYLMASNRSQRSDSEPRAHMQRLGLSHTENCPCHAGPQTPEHAPQPCLHAEARLQHWTIWTTLADKLWGSKDDLVTTTNFINGTGLRI